jgi:hypothetical protein
MWIPVMGLLQITPSIEVLQGIRADSELSVRIVDAIRAVGCADACRHVARRAL